MLEAKFMLPWNFSLEEAAAEEGIGAAAAQYVGDRLADGRAVIHHRRPRLVEMTIPADPLYQHLLLTGEEWRCVQSGEPPRLFGIEPPRPRVEAVRTVDMSSSGIPQPLQTFIG